MAAKTQQPLNCNSKLAVRGSQGIHLLDPLDSTTPPQVLSSLTSCRVMKFSDDGSRFAWCDGEKVCVSDTWSGSVLYSLNAPKTRCLAFSPKGTYIATWEPYAVNKDNPQGSCNLRVWRGEELVAEHIQKRQQGWCPQWTEDERLCARSVSAEIHFFDGGLPGRSVDNRLHAEGLGTFALSPGPAPYHTAVFLRATKGKPAFVRLYQYPVTSSAIANRSFFKGDNVAFFWNKKGTAALALTSTDMDKTGESYYGEQALHFLSVKGDGNMVQLDKKGPVYAVAWSPTADEFCVVYGFMPSKAALFNTRCEVLFDFGIAHRNTALYNHHGNVLLLGGFGNLRGNVEFWNAQERKVVAKVQASDTTQLEWSPDGQHVATATAAPRLREGNGFKLWHFSGGLLAEHPTPKPAELWEISWQPSPPDSFAVPDLTEVKETCVSQVKVQSQPAAVYRPPGLRGKPSSGLKLHDEVKDDKAEEKLSKSALKNKKKRESKTKSEGQPPPTSSRPRTQEQSDVLAVAAYIVGSAPQPSLPQQQPDKDKKLRNLKKKLKQIEDLKQRQVEGQVLEQNQDASATYCGGLRRLRTKLKRLVIEKIKGEAALLEEISKLEITES